MKRGYVVKCIQCSKEYDLIKATNMTKGTEIRCPHCRQVVGTRNS